MGARGADGRFSHGGALKVANASLLDVYKHLKKRGDFITVSRNGTARRACGVVVLFFQNGGCRIGFTASRKVGGAVKRNRARRRLKAAVKEIFKTKKQIFATGDYVFVARKKTATRPYTRLCADIHWALSVRGGSGRRGDGT